MARTALTKEECKEYFDSPDELQKKIEALADLIRGSKHFVAFSGAGISTGAGIADFRSGVDTVLDTGAGAWTKKAAQQKGELYKKAKRKVSTLCAYPTAAHMALVALMKSGHLKYLISQNTDGLHRRSGISIDQLSELHGNSCLEVCDKCGKEYMRDYHCRNRASRREATQLSKEEKKGRWRHRTGRRCNVQHCKGNLCDSVIGFGEHLPFNTLALAQQESQKADLYLALGSSLAVTPACDMPEAIGKKWLKQKKRKMPITHNLVIVNLQKTPLHNKCSLPIFGKIDEIMVGVMKELKVPIPKWFLNRLMKITVFIHENNRRLIIGGVDSDGTNFEVFKKIQLKYDGQILKHKKINDIEHEYVVKEWEANKLLQIQLQFFGNYKEPNLEIVLNEYLTEVMMKGGDVMLRMMMEPKTKKWHKTTKWVASDLLQLDLRDICLMKLYKTSYGYDGQNAISFANNKRSSCLPAPQKITEYITSDKHNVTWVEGKTGKEDLMTYTKYYSHLGLLFCYFYDFYIPQIKIKILNGIFQELYGEVMDEEILCSICEFQGMCNLFDHFLVGDYFNPYPFYQNLIINRMFADIDQFPPEWVEFINKYSHHRQMVQ